MTGAALRLGTTADAMRLAAAAWVACVTHVLAAVGSLLLLRPGTPIEPDAAARAAYVDANLAVWRLGWALWLLATVALFFLLRALDRRAAILVVPGLAVDVLSQLALAIPVGASDLAYRGSGVVANGLYTLALYLALARAALPLALHRGGLVVVAFGVAVALASLVLHPTALLLSTAGLAAGMVLWTAALGVWSWRASS